MWDAVVATASWLVDAVFPHRCAACRRVAADALCPDCVAVVSALPRPSSWNEPYGRCSAAFTHSGLVRTLILAGKYGGQRRALAALAALGAERLVDLRQGSSPEAIVAVPLGPRRRRRRGYNQAAVVADQVAALAPHAPRDDRLRRVRETPSQVGRSRAERLTNLVDAFEWVGPRLGGWVWLVDDVVSTGATLRAAATALQRAGAVRIEAVALASSGAGERREWARIEAGSSLVPPASAH